MDKSYLIKRKSLLLAGIKESGNEDTIIPFSNMSLQVGNSDPDNIIIPSLEEIIRINAEIAESNFDIQYSLEYTTPELGFANTLPTSDELNALYDGVGLEVKKFDGTQVTLLRGSANELHEGEGISVVELGTGIFEVAGFQADTILISNIKNDLPAQLSALDVRISKNETDITTHDNRVTDLETNTLNITNDKDVASTGSIDEDTVDTNKLPTREDVRSLGAKLKGEVAVDVTDLKNQDINFESRIATLENLGTAANYLTAFRKWTGTLDGTNPTTPANPVLPGDNTIAFDLSTITSDDGNPFEFANNEDLTIWFKATLNGIELEMNLLVQAGKTIPQLIEVIRGSNRTSLEALTANLSSTGILTMTRNEGTELDFSTIKIEEVTEAVLASSSSLVLKSDLAKETSDREAAVNLKQDKNDNAISDPNTDSVVGAINNLIARTDNNEADVDELNLGKFDVKGDGTKITEIFDANGDLNAAVKDLTNVNVGVTNAGKMLSVESNGDLKYETLTRIKIPAIYEWKGVLYDAFKEEDAGKKIRIRYDNTQYLSGTLNIHGNSYSVLGRTTINYSGDTGFQFATWSNNSSEIDRPTKVVVYRFRADNSNASELANYDINEIEMWDIDTPERIIKALVE